MSKTTKKFAPEVREQAVRMVLVLLPPSRLLKKAWRVRVEMVHRG